MLTKIRFACRADVKHSGKLGDYEITRFSHGTLREKEKDGLEEKKGKLDY